jgi:hypothetical protein
VTTTTIATTSTVSKTKMLKCRELSSSIVNSKELDVSFSPCKWITLLQYLVLSTTLEWKIRPTLRAISSCHSSSFSDFNRDRVLSRCCRTVLDSRCASRICSSLSPLPRSRRRRSIPPTRKSYSERALNRFCS